MTALKLNYRVISKTEVDTIMAHYQGWGDLLLHGTPLKSTPSACTKPRKLTACNVNCSTKPPHFPGNNEAPCT